MAETATILFFVRCYTFLFAPIATILSKLRIRHGAGSLNLPPGPWKLPVLGARPHEALHKLAQQHGPVMLLRLGNTHALVLSSSEAAREVHASAAFAHRPDYAAAENILGELLGPTRVRSFRPVMEEEVARIVSHIHFGMSFMGPVPVNFNFGEPTKDMMKDVFTRVCVGETAKANTDKFLPRVSLGDRCPRWEEYLKELDTATTGPLMFGLSLADLFPTSCLERVLGGGSLRAWREAHGRIQSAVDAMIREHKTTMERKEADDDAGHDVPRKGIIGRKGLYFPLGGAAGAYRFLPCAAEMEADDDDAGGDVPREDILTTLLRLHSNGGVTLTNEIVSTILIDIFSAGSVAATTITWAMSELVRSPTIMTMAQSEVRRVIGHRTRHKSTVAEADIDGQLPYLHMVIRETFRLHPLVPLLHPMVCTERSKIMGYDVLPGTTVFVTAWAIGRDEESWSDDATQFIPERWFDNEKVDYGGDSDFRFFSYSPTPSVMFALSNIQIALASLLYHLDWDLPNGENSVGQVVWDHDAS